MADLDLSIDGAALLVACAVLNREAEEAVARGELEVAEHFLRSAQSITARYDLVRPFISDAA